MFYRTNRLPLRLGVKRSQDRNVKRIAVILSCYVLVAFVAILGYSVV